MTEKTLPFSSGPNRGTVRQTIVTNLEAPRLTGVATKHFTAFQKKRELYEKQVEEKNREPGVKITPTSYRASIEDSYLRMFLTAHWIKATSLLDIKEDQIRDFIKTRASYEPKGHELGRIDRVVKNVKMDLSVKEAEDRVWTLHHHYISVLEATGIPDLPEKKPHISIKHIHKRIKPAVLRQRMKDISLWRKDEHFDKKDFGAFMRELASQAKKLEEEQESRSAHVSSNSDSSADTSDSDEGGKARRQRKKRSPSGRAKKRNRDGVPKKNQEPSPSQDNRNITNDARKKRPFELPDCLNPKCHEKHFVADCPISTETEKRKLKDDYHARKKRVVRFEMDKPSSDSRSKHKGSIRRIGAKAIDDHSSLFSAAFAMGAVESVVMADQGSDGNIMPPAVFAALKEAVPGLEIETLDPPHSFNFLDESSGLICSEGLVTDVQLRIRHGTKLLLRNLRWHVSDTETEFVVIGRKVLEAIGCDNKAMLSAACDKHDGVINVPKALAADAAARATQGTIASLVSEGIFHSDEGGEEVDALDESGVYIDIGEDPDADRDAALEASVLEAQEQGLSPSGAESLRQIIDKHRSIFD